MPPFIGGQIAKWVGRSECTHFKTPVLSFFSQAEPTWTTLLINAKMPQVCSLRSGEALYLLSSLRSGWMIRLRTVDILKKSLKYGGILKHGLFVLLLCVASLFASLSEAQAKGERIENVTVETVDQEVYVSAKLTGGFRKEIIDDIQNGIPKHFYYYLVLKRKEKNWFDEEILSKTIRYTVKYDTLKKIYAVTESSNGTSLEKQFNEFKAMKEMVTQVNHVRIAALAPLKKGERYFVSVQSQMQAAKPPFYLDYFLFFIPFLEIDTPWANSPPISFSGGK